tara:strand:- start:6615 stop:7781 length:1167 start_codon:yes stop_codon:yes gene_type:complete
MSVAAKSVGFVDKYISSEKFANVEQGTNDVARLYREGKEYTYILAISGHTPDEQVIIDPPFSNVVSVEVVQARIPFTEYTIESDRRFIYYKINNGGSNDYISGVIELTIRDYTNDEIVEEFNAQAKAKAEWLNLIRLGEEEGTGKFFFYTIRRDPSTANKMGSETSYNYTADPSQVPKFQILATTTAFYPLGYSTKTPDKDRISSAATFRVVSNGVDETASTGTYLQVVTCENRYNLVVSDVVTLSCTDIDNRLNRGNTSPFVMPLAEFFLASPGMNESTFQKAIPDRPMQPQALSSLNLHFTRLNTSSKDDRSTVPYKFRGIKWFLKVAVKTLEYPAATAENKESFANVNVSGFKNTSGPSQSTRVIVSPTTPGLPSAYNSGNYGRV